MNAGEKKFCWVQGIQALLLWPLCMATVRSTPCLKEQFGSLVCTSFLSHLFCWAILLNAVAMGNSIEVRKPA